MRFGDANISARPCRRWPGSRSLAGLELGDLRSCRGDEFVVGVRVAGETPAARYRGGDFGDGVLAGVVHPLGLIELAFGEVGAASAERGYIDDMRDDCGAGHHRHMADRGRRETRETLKIKLEKLRFMR